METVLYVIHIIVCFALIPIILLQSGKGGGVSAAFGGGGTSTVFGARGASTFLTRMTTVAAIVFMCTSLGLAYLSSHGSRSVVGDVAPIEEADQEVTTGKTGDEPGDGQGVGFGGDDKSESKSE